MMEPWTLERAFYDIRIDQYWLVTRTATQYRFVGPVSPSLELVEMLPEMDRDELKEVKRLAPSLVGLNTYVVEPSDK